MKAFIKNHKKLMIILLIVIIVFAALAVFLSMKAKKSMTSEIAYKEYTVERTSISQELTGSGSLTAANSYTVKTLASGEIASASFEEGDIVEKDQVLYTIDSSDSSTDDKRNIKSTVDGYIYSLNVDIGDDVKQGQEIATLVYNDQMKMVIPFSAIDAAQFNVGDTATVTLDGSFEELEGRVENISALVKLVDGNIQTKDVTIIVNNKGGLGINQYASAEIAGCSSIGTACFEYKYSTTLKAESSGTVAYIYAAEGSPINKNQTIVYLEKDDSLIRELTSPIQGTVVDKAYKTGETVESGTTLATIYDLSYLAMTLNIDELDIAKVKVGQTVIITADATPNVKYEGVVTKVSVAGSYSGGTATYPITIRIDEYGDLLPSMSADATIVLSSAEDVLAVPSAAVQRGNKVMLTADSPSAAGKETEENGYVYVDVTTGVSDDNNTEITSGLQEGDKVVYQQATVSSWGNFGGMPGMSGGMPSGGSMPSGGGSMPSGGGSMPSGGMPSGGGRN